MSEPKLLGFKVSATLGRECVSDTFELRQSAIDCARVLDRMGLRGITVRELQATEHGELYVPPLDWANDGKPEGVAA